MNAWSLQTYISMWKVPILYRKYTSEISNSRPNLPFADPVPPNTMQYLLIPTKYQSVSSYTDPQVSLIIHHLVFSSANWIFSLFTIHLMSHAQYTWSSFCDVAMVMVFFQSNEWCFSDTFFGLCPKIGTFLPALWSSSWHIVHVHWFISIFIGP